jgi:hypothetical protein
MTTYYMLSHEDPGSLDPDPRPLQSCQIHVGYLLDRSRSLLGWGPYFGAWVIDEQERPGTILPNVHG